MKCLAVVALLVATPLLAQKPFELPTVQETPSLAFLYGEWQREGSLMGKPSRVELMAKPILDGWGVVLDYRVLGLGGDAIFAGHAVYRVSSQGRWEGRWLDSGGVFRDLSGSVLPGRMTVTWGSPATEIGRTTYALEGGTLVLTDEVLRASGQFEVFASAKLKRP